MSDIIELENKYYISVNSTYADDRTKVLNYANTFGIFDRWGNIRKIGEEVQGIYHNGTRFISDLELRIQDDRFLLLSSSVKEENEILSIDLTNPAMNDANGKPVPKDTLYVGRSKFLREGACFEKVTIHNYGNETYAFDLTLYFNADFKDIFEIRGISRQKRGEVYEIVHTPDNKLRISYLGLDEVKRSTEICFDEKPSGWSKSNKAIFRIQLNAHEEKDFYFRLCFITGDEVGDGQDYSTALASLEDELKKGGDLTARIITSNEQFNQWINRSQFDLLSLLANTKYGRYPYAGVPWYNTAFGRDGIITALQTLWMAPSIANDVLTYLARTQATETNPYRDAEPGKVIHEVRSGEMVELKEIPFKKYYGSVDATPLFITLAGAYYRRTGDLETIKGIWDNIAAALNWIDQYGDIDGDGFVEYQHKNENGLTNQGWKDSFDSISDQYGNLANPPIALCEVQGYVYDAKLQAAMLAEKLGFTDKAAQLRQQADALKRNFNEKFWDEALQCFVIALDGDKKPCRIVSSNAGHCLFSGIADEALAAKAVARLMQPDMFNGWGVRTLSSKEVRYNPMSYHNGSVWPHDVAIIAKGFARYGFHAEMLKLTDGLFDASLYIDLQRLPELFCGFDRRRGEGPTNYPVACSPQAWAVGSLFMLLGACLGIDIHAEEKKVYFHKGIMPPGIETLLISNLKLGDGNARIKLNDGNASPGVEVKECPADWQVLFVS